MDEKELAFESTSLDLQIGIPLTSFLKQSIDPLKHRVMFAIYNTTDRSIGIAAYQCSYESHPRACQDKATFMQDIDEDKVVGNPKYFSRHSLPILDRPDLPLALQQLKADGVDIDVGIIAPKSYEYFHDESDLLPCPQHDFLEEKIFPVQLDMDFSMEDWKSGKVQRFLDDDTIDPVTLYWDWSAMDGRLEKGH
ncbi:hypothetical protein A1O3_01152 [Capronia epimyces CBS 606.96]|uniref:Uncharacterized protein n=1 Tax=Capronia epimyces CBS 606.96 TaxID=1182542 RepID=W9YSG0_9EURO|nr:uncharacterized protein A1O3_01152 [Capronia epimyces CBS 606.96]EXJ92600.1 hypothetical protein A1O3_01152 [Capronia epimyces CBS 606.96]